MGLGWDADFLGIDAMLNKGFRVRYFEVALRGLLADFWPPEGDSGPKLGIHQLFSDFLSSRGGVICVGFLRLRRLPPL